MPRQHSLIERKHIVQAFQRLAARPANLNKKFGVSVRTIKKWELEFPARPCIDVAQPPWEDQIEKPHDEHIRPVFGCNLCSRFARVSK